MLTRIARFGIPAIVLWSLLVWGSRVRNILADDDLTGRDRNVSLAIAGGFVLGALWAFRSAYGLWRDGAADPLTCVTGAGLALALANLVIWPVRAYQILGGDWDGGFKAVHTVLAVISVLLGLLVLFHRYGRAGNSRSVRNSQSVADPV